jgi:hypothetical protein
MARPVVLTRENNELICRVGPDTAMGKALRRYWLPVLQTIAGLRPLFRSKS